MKGNGNGGNDKVCRQRTWKCRYRPTSSYNIQWPRLACWHCAV